MQGDRMNAGRIEKIQIEAAQTPSSDELESDDNLVRGWQDALREAHEKMETYRADASSARTFAADVRDTEAALVELPRRIASHRAEIAYNRWAKDALAGLPEIPVVSMDRAFASVRKDHLLTLAPELARAIPKKSRLWADWSVWNFKRQPLDRSTALPAEAVRLARGSMDHFERIEVWQAVGMADPWLVGVMHFFADRERFYLLHDWGIETSPTRVALR
ncbi:MAG TPA: hypothetical protein VEO20_00510 [Thermoplasmata archaeon]|nr:hypothetical protein [Thermoplasmata archaeon]